MTVLLPKLLFWYILCRAICFIIILLLWTLTLPMLTLISCCLKYINQLVTNFLLFLLSGVLCNFEGYYTGTWKAANRFFCVPESLCRKGVHRFSLMPSNGCSKFMQNPIVNGKEENLVCCHQEELLHDITEHWKKLLYLPGVRSYMSEL